MTTLKCAGESHPGRVRDNNEDRLYFDADRGIFVVIDGVGGQAAGEVAADTAVRVLRARLERQTGTVRERIVEGITLANNEIFRLAQTNPEWAGMACVLTAAVVEGGQATVGHVGDTRLYKVHRGQLRKVTRDHSPVGVLEDTGHLAEVEAMHHPRRNEVMRDVGSAEHTPDDEEFIDIYEVPFEADAALLLCSDGLSDLVTSEQMLRTIRQHVGNRARIVRRLIELANEAGGKDNVTVLFVEGEQCASSMRRQLLGIDEANPPEEPAPQAAELMRTQRDGGGVTRTAAVPSAPPPAAPAAARVAAPPAARPDAPDDLLQIITGRWAFLLIGLVAGALLSALLFRLLSPRPAALNETPAPQQARPSRTHLVGEGASIAEALERAQPGETVLVAPGEYREAVRLKEGVSLVSQIPRAAAILPPRGAQGDFVAVSAENVQGGRFVGFEIKDEGGRLTTGLRLVDSAVEIDGVDVSGARAAGVEIKGRSTPTLRASHVHHNGGAGVVINGGAPKLVHNLFDNGGGADGDRPPDIDVIQPASPSLTYNVFTGGLEGVRGIGDAGSLRQNNFFVKAQAGGTLQQGDAQTPARGGPPPNQ